MKPKKQIRDIFKVSDGNLEVLINIPKMMKIEKYRIQLRKLVIDFLYEGYGKTLDRRIKGDFT